MANIIVLDTNVLLHDPNALFSFKGDRIVIPMTVIEEIDNFKKGVDEIGRNARQISRYLDKLRKDGSLQNGVEIENDTIIQVVMSKKIESITSDLMISDENDNLIIGTALYMQKNNPKDRVIMVSKDANIRIKADAVGLEANDFEADRVKFEELFTGYSDLEVDSSVVKSFQETKKITSPEEGFFPNQFVKLINKDNPEITIITRFNHEDNTLNELTHYTGGIVFGIKARNDEQTMAIDLLLDDKVQMVSLIGKAGTGKTLIAIAAGLQKVVEENRYSRLVISRPISPLGKDLGYLPGTKGEKFDPWMQPIYDNMEILIHSHGEQEESRNGKIFSKKRPSINDYLDHGFIELEPLTYIRGRSLPDQYIIIDEAQNLTPHEMKTIITRAGEGTKIVLTGDPYQIDIPYLDSESNGLSMSVEKLKKEEIVGHITLEKGERSRLADIAARYF
ncbi:MAG: PhoH family protein [Candidatus Cloacimonetes bacterium]|nr:PhoH family protein [Candidatus Cloacimonadota bacterium]